MGIHRLLQSELQSLKAEAGKKCPKIRDSAECVDRQLREIADSGAETDSAVADALRDFNETLQPGLLAIETRTPKFILLGLSYLQRLASYDAIDADHFQVVGQVLRSICDSSEEIVHLKIIQTITTIMQAPTLLANAKVTFMMTESLLTLYNNRSPSISNTAAAALRQSVSSLFEVIEGEAGESRRTEEQAAQESETVTESSRMCLENACALFREMCILAEKGVSKELKFKSVISSQTDWLCLEVVDTCLRCHSRLFDRHVVLANVLRANACSMVLNKLQGLIHATGTKKDHVFGLSVRVMRVTAALLTVRNSTAGLGSEICRVMAILTQMTSGEYPLFHRTLALEVIYTFSSKEGFANRVKELHSSRDGPAGDAVENGVVGLVHGLERVIHRALGVSRLPMASASAIALAKSTLETLATGTDEAPTVRILQMLGSEPPVGLATESACVDLALASLSNIVAALSELCGIPCIPFDDDCPRQLANKPLCDLDVLVLNVEVVRDIIDSAWEPILEALQTIMVSVLAPGILQRVLRAYTNFTQTCGALQLVGPRDRALAPLCKYAVPSPTQEGSMAPLYAHHILMCRALLCIVLALGGVLGETWILVLEAMQRLDSALVDRGFMPMSHSQNPAKNSSSKGENAEVAKPVLLKTWSQGRLETELVSLRQMLDSLFEQTSSLDESTAIQLMSALCRVSLSSISDARPDILPASSGGKSERMFGVEKLVEIVKHNLFRVGRLWEPAVSQLSQLGVHTRRSVRQYGMSNITQLVILSFKARVEAEKMNSSEDIAEGKAAKARLGAEFDGVNEQEFDMERRLLAVYEELYRSQFVDTKNYVLDGLYTVLQSCGEQVGPAWPMVLAMLKGVAQDKEAQQQDKEAQQVKRAFMCVQLIRNDLLSALPVDCLQLFLTTVGAFGLQDCDLNISLTAITLLWNIADFFGRERPALLAAFAVVGVLSPPQSPTNGKEQDVAEKINIRYRREVHNVDQLWLVLYQQLRLLAVDSRLEVRNSALRTLFTALETHGNVLENDSWRQVVEELLLRVLEDVEQGALQSASDAPVERPLGPATATVSGGDGNRGAQQMMLIHHSRNTLSKQWHVSWETAFQGVIRMIMTYFKKVCELEGHKHVWATLMEHFGSCLLKGSDQVVISGMASVKDLLFSTTGGSSGSSSMCIFPRIFWKQLWETIHQSISSICVTSGYSMKSLKSILTELSIILELPGVSLSGYVDKETVLLYIVILDDVICSLFTNAAGSTSISALVETAFAGFSVVVRLIKTQAQPAEESLWLAVCKTILLHLPDHKNRYAWWPEHIVCDMDHERKFARPIANTDMNSKLLVTLSRLFDCEAPPPIKSLLLEQISVKVMATMCTARYYEPQRDLWRRAAEVWVQTVRAGIPALNECNRSSVADKDRVWYGIARGLKSFMLPEESIVAAEARESVDEAQRSEQVDISLVAFVVQDLLICAPSTEIQMELLEVVDGGAGALQRMPTVSLSDSPVSFRFYLAEQSLDLLFSLAVGQDSVSSELSTSSLSLARLAAPVLVKRCASILETFVKDEAEAASCPLPRARTDQAVTTARRLEQLQLHPAVCQHLFDSRTVNSDIAGCKMWGRSGKRGHLILLYGPLCRAIGASNAALRESVRSSLEIVGWELAIGNCEWSAVVGRAGCAPFGCSESGGKAN